MPAGCSADPGEPEAESGPDPELALDLEVGAVQVQDLGHECEPEARSSGGSCVRMTTAEEALPDVAPLVGRYPGSVVLDRDDSLPSLAGRGDPDVASRRRVLRGVREQVLDHPLDQEGIG